MLNVKKHFIVISLFLVGLAVWWQLALSHFNLKAAAEKAHGIKLPASASKLQLKKSGKSWLQLEPYDGGVLTMFEMSREELPAFLGQLMVRSRQPPRTQGPGDPCINGWNVWPVRSATFVPGDKNFRGLKKTWSGSALPVEMLSCKSNTGDWLHVEVWDVSDHVVIKLYTDWN